MAPPPHELGQAPGVATGVAPDRVPDGVLGVHPGRVPGEVPGRVARPGSEAAPAGAPPADGPSWRTGERPPSVVLWSALAALLVAVHPLVGGPPRLLPVLLTCAAVAAAWIAADRRQRASRRLT